MGSWQSRAACAEQGSSREFLDDGRLLADFVVYLRDNYDAENFRRLRRELWDVELHPNDAEKYELSGISEAWEAYREDQKGFLNFDNLQEWSQHDLPHKDIISRVGNDLVDEEDQMYSFAVAAMIGIHVATICSAIADGHEASDASCDESYEPPELEDLDELLSTCVRRFKVPVEGSAYSPKHILPAPFEIEEFAPTLFHSLRSLSAVSDYDYMDSLCRLNFQFIKFGSNSKSGEFFFFSQDKKFLIKTCTAGEARTLLEMLPDFRDRFIEEPNSILGRYLGLYRVNQNGVKPRLFFIMLASPRSSLKVHKIYDLKGSTRHRRSKPGDAVGKDLNFQDNIGHINLDEKTSKKLLKIYERDLELLSDYDIMDYSLLLQIHYDDERDPTLSHAASEDDELEDEDSPDEVRWIDPPADHCTTPCGEQSVTWLHNALQQAPRRTVAGICEGNPSSGITSRDGSQIYFFALIDILVRFDAYPKAQYLGYQIQTCGKGYTASRVPPDLYLERQLQMFRKVVGLDQVEDDEDVES